MLRDRFEARYSELVTAWMRHHDLRRRGAALPVLAESRLTLDRLRDVTNALRRAHAPEPGEMEDALVTTYCDRLGETVFLFSADAEWHATGPRFLCVCGNPIDGEGDRVKV
ncbi:MAG: hypothetical protein ACE5GC_03355 [Acidimicrobiia bacterium]